MLCLRLHQEGRLLKIQKKLKSKLSFCTLCPRSCKVNRLKGETGFCRAKSKAIVSSAFLHFGEELELVGTGGSGTIFFSYCNLGCLYCQNYTLSHLGEGRGLEAQELAGLMLGLQNQGAENINFVTPTHMIAQILEALPIAIEKGLNLPLVYNCGGYESVETLKILEGVFDIYMPDVKYAERMPAEKFSQAADYWKIAQAAVKEMHRQAGDLIIEGGIAKRGLLIRHLVLPNRLAGSFKIIDFIRKELSPNTYINIMDQYYPCHGAYEFNEISRRITFPEYQEVVEYAKQSGLHRGF